MKLLYAIEAAARPGRIRKADVRGEEEDLRLRPQGLPHRGPARDPLAPDVGGPGAVGGSTNWFDMSRKMELFVKQEKKLNANVDFYSASTYTTLGIDIDPVHSDLRRQPHRGLGRPRHRAARRNRLIRPRADYIGPPYPEPYIPIAERYS